MTRRRAAMALLAGLLLPGCRQETGGVGVSESGGVAGENPEWILVGAQIVTGDPSRPRGEAVAIASGRIVAVGPRGEVERLAGPGTRVEEMPGAVILPGLVDAHGHVESLGLSLRRVDLRAASSYSEVVDRIRVRSRERPPGTWVLGRGWDQPLGGEGGGFPDHGELSAAVPDHPVLVSRVDGHAALANAAALRLAGIGERTPDPAGGRILRRPDGTASGVLIDNAIGLIEKLVPPPDRGERLDAVERALRHLASLGLTGVHDAGVGAAGASGAGEGEGPGWESVGLYRELLAQGRLPLRVYVMLGGNSARPPEDGDFDRPPVIGEGDGMLTVRAMKIGVDGALGSRGAALEAPYSDEPGQRGLVTRDEASLRAILERGFRSGWQIAVHAIGDRGNRMVLDAVAAARAAVPQAGDVRPRIEHAQVLRVEDLPRFAALGVIASVQPTHATSDCRWAEARLGPDRLIGAYAYGSLLRAGAVLACGSDFPVESANPLLGIVAAVARQDGNGQPPEGFRPEEAIDIVTALSCFTRGAAYASFSETDVGQIAPGQRADFTVLDGDPTAVPAAQVGRLRVIRTVVGGRVTYERPDGG